MDDGGDKRRRTGNASAQDGVLPFGLMSLLSDILALKQIGEEDDDDDAAPEEVSLAAGRAGAAAARREEREMAARQKRLAKEKGRKRAALAEAERDARLAAQGVVPRGRVDATAEEGEEEGEGEDDLLPADVVEAIAQRSREAAAAQPEADMDEEPLAAAKKPKNRVDPSQPKKVGPFLVQPLSKLPQNKASEAAQQFVRQRMFGRGVKRSAEMLVPSTARYYGPALTF
ncbi:hypothetical protein WJX75_009381 [Coccomyxa subellipsoidea]|uniref:Ribosome biogenesis protein NOP53 n=1 Tax=Coccomyxa subellipsoidea TaxID=248742 RepID=A0ABR2Z154_9CHLO